MEQQLLAGLTPQAMSQIIASSFEFQADHTGQSPADVVTSLYQSGLGRTPAASEEQGWVSQVQAGAAPAAVTYGIATSAEAAARLPPTIRPVGGLTVSHLPWISAPHPGGPVAEW